MADFAHLHCHTEYSLLDGAIRLDDLCASAKNFGFSAAAITDHGNLYGAAYFYAKCKDYGLKPVIGCEVYTCKDHTKKTEEFKRRNHLLLLAKTNVGYHNLVKLVTRSWREGFYYKPRVDKELLRRYSDGLICLSACLAGEIPQAVMRKDMAEAKKLIAEFREIYPDRFYLELQSNGLKTQEQVNEKLLELAASENIPIVATNDCHYLTRDDAYAHEVLLCVQTQTNMEDPDRMILGAEDDAPLPTRLSGQRGTGEFYYKSYEEMLAAFGATPDALSNAAEIADSCEVELDFGHHYFPVYPLAEGESLESEFCRLAREGLEKRLANFPEGREVDAEKYRERLEYELKVILEMGFPGYFLIVQEFINWAKDRGIPVGPGRGSAAGSLVAWALRITNLDPLPYNLLFERFLNIERVSLPDIDVDFCERRRGEVIQHMVDRYGEGSVAQITTFGTMKAKGVIRDVGRALGLSFADTDKIARLVPESLKMTIDLAMEAEPQLRKLYAEDKRVKELIDIAKRLEKLARHASTHAAGLVVSDKPMEEYLPLYTGKRGELVTQFDGPMTEKSGLVKFDFLGLKTMTLIDDALKNIKLNGKEPPNLDILDLTDQGTYELYSRGDTDGVFQVESSGMRQYLRMLRPSCFEDIIAMLALYRPGPLGSGMVDEFIKRKHGQVPVVYPDESLRGCLADTYGVIVYQEQVMQIAQIIANYTLGGADLLRRAMGKKKAEAMAKERTKFVAGAAEKGIDEQKANGIFDLMEKFAEYGFNKSHSAAYALISYYTAWLKVHYKVEFMAALLTSEMGNQDKLLKYIAACRDMGIEVAAPSVNESERNFRALGDKILFGLGGVKNIGDEAIKTIIEARGDKPYASFYDLLCRIQLRKVNKRVLEALIKSGACDCFGVSRAGLLACYEIAADKAAKESKRKSPQISLLGVAKPGEADPAVPGLGLELREANLSEMPEEQLLMFEKEALGFFLSSHPLQAFTGEIARHNFLTLESAAEQPSGAIINAAVLVTNVKEVLTKASGKRMAFVEVEDLTGHAEVTFFPDDYARCREAIQSEKPLLLSARLEAGERGEEREDEEGEGRREIKLLGKSAQLLELVCGRSDAPVTIDIPQNRLNEPDLMDLKVILENFKGDAPVKVRIEKQGYWCVLTVSENIKVRPDKEFHSAIRKWEAASQGAA